MLLLGFGHIFRSVLPLLSNPSTTENNSKRSFSPGSITREQTLFLRLIPEKRENSGGALLSPALPPHRWAETCTKPGCSFTPAWAQVCPAVTGLLQAPTVQVPDYGSKPVHQLVDNDSYRPGKPPEKAGEVLTKWLTLAATFPKKKRACLTAHVFHARKG